MTSKYTPIEALTLLIDHASEQYPHFESPRGQRDIARAREALAHVSELVGALELAVRLIQSYENPQNIVSSVQLDALEVLEKARGGVK